MSAVRDRERVLAARREVLLARSARLRDELADAAGDLGARLRLFDRGFALGRQALASGRARRLLPVIAFGVALVVARPGRWLRLASRALVLWPVVKPLLPYAARALRPRSSPPPLSPPPAAPMR